ncbi:MAG: hypothetical protein WCC87_03595 [Candidatus Korobacteraceae bacterium]
MKEVYNKLFDCLTSAGYSPRRQNVSLNITVSRNSVDLVQAFDTISWLCWVPNLLITEIMVNRSRRRLAV